jgi:outer membrane protein assembly factor BamE (lipoprotein component of BamABCDE complex)
MTCSKFLLPVLFTVALLNAGCSPTIENRGFNTENAQFSQIQPGIQSKQQVMEILGSPSTIPSFDANRWYYISRKTSATCFFTPVVLEQQVTVITFNQAGIVSDIKIYKGEDAKNIKPVSRQTETNGEDSSMLREVFSNFGRMSTKKPT